MFFAIWINSIFAKDDAFDIKYMRELNKLQVRELCVAYSLSLCLNGFSRPKR